MQILVKCFDLVLLCPGDVTVTVTRYVDYLRQFLIFCPRNFDGQSRVRCPEAIAHHLDENQKLEALTYDSPPNAPISALTTPYSAARSWLYSDLGAFRSRVWLYSSFSWCYLGLPPRIPRGGPHG